MSSTISLRLHHLPLHFTSVTVYIKLYATTIIQLIIRLSTKCFKNPQLLLHPWIFASSAGKKNCMKTSCARSVTPQNIHSAQKKQKKEKSQKHSTAVILKRLFRFVSSTNTSLILRTKTLKNRVLLPPKKNGFQTVSMYQSAAESMPSSSAKHCSRSLEACLK